MSRAEWELELVEFLTKGKLGWITPATTWEELVSIFEGLDEGSEPSIRTDSISYRGLHIEFFDFKIRAIIIDCNPQYWSSIFLSQFPLVETARSMNMQTAERILRENSIPYWKVDMVFDGVPENEIELHSKGIPTALFKPTERGEVASISWFRDGIKPHNPSLWTYTDPA